MSSVNERIFVIGASGEIGTEVVRGLIRKGIQTTAYIRNETKAKELFKDEIQSGNLNIVVGDYSSIDVYRKAIGGHTRLFLLVFLNSKRATSMKETKESLGKIAYEQGVRQIVDLSSFTVRHCGRQGIIAYAHTTAEQALWNLAEQNPDQRSLVVLRPGAFMTNHLMMDVFNIKKSNKIIALGSPQSSTTWIDPKDISDSAVTVLTDPIDKHHFLIYEMGSQKLTNEERAKIFSDILGKTITYEQQSPESFYNQCIQHGMEHSFAYDLLTLGLDEGICALTPQLSILVNRSLRTLQDWIKDNRDQFQ